MPSAEALIRWMLWLLAASALAIGCSSTTHVKGTGESGSGGDSAAAGAAGSARGGDSGDAGSSSGAAGAEASSGAAGSTGSGAGGAAGSGAAAGVGGGGSAGAAGGTGSGGASGAGGSGASGAGGGGASGAGGGGASGAGGVGGAAGAGGNDGCSVLKCAGSGSCCIGTGVFVLDTPLQNYRDRPDLVLGFSATASSVLADFRFDASGQRGNIGFDLVRATDIQSLVVDAAYSGVADYPYVGLETDGGSRGCAYALLGTVADLSYPLFCWGAAFYLDETTRINVRVDSFSTGPAQLSIYSVDVN